MYQDDNNNYCVHNHLCFAHTKPASVAVPMMQLVVIAYSRSTLQYN